MKRVGGRIIFSLWAPLRLGAQSCPPLLQWLQTSREKRLEPSPGTWALWPVRTSFLSFFFIQEMPFRGHLAPIEFPRWWLFYWVLSFYDRHHFSLFLRLLCDSAFKINPRLSQAPPGSRETSEPPFPSSCTRDLHSGGPAQGQIQKIEMCLVGGRGCIF